MGGDLLFIAAAACVFIAIAGVGFAFSGNGETRTQKSRLAAAVGNPSRAQSVRSLRRTAPPRSASRFRTV